MRRLRSLRLMMGVLALSSASAAAFAQRLDPRIAQTLTVGPPSGPTPTWRGDGARRGRAVVVPASPRIAWRKELGQPTPVPPLARANGNTVIVTGKAELIELDATGNEALRFRLSTDAPVSASLLSDDTLLVATSRRELAVVRTGAVVHLRRVGYDRDSGAREDRPGAVAGASSILPLDDGGAVVAFDEDVLAVDRDGRMRARAVFPAPIRGALVADRSGVLATLATGSIVSWMPGAEVRRLWRFSAPVLGPVMQTEQGVVVGLVEGPSLIRFDMGRATSTLLVGATHGTGLGLPSAVSGGSVLLTWAGGRSSVVELDADGRERRRVQVALSAMADAGAGPSGQGPLLPEVLVDPEGRIAFVSPDGTAGVVDRDGTVRTLGETVCFKGRRSTPLSSSTSLVATPRGFLIACDNGNLLDIEP